MEDEVRLTFLTRFFMSFSAAYTRSPIGEDYSAHDKIEKQQKLCGMTDTRDDDDGDGRDKR